MRNGKWEAVSEGIDDRSSSNSWQSSLFVTLPLSHSSHHQLLVWNSLKDCHYHIQLEDGSGDRNALRCCDIEEMCVTICEKEFWFNFPSLFLWIHNFVIGFLPPLHSNHFCIITILSNCSCHWTEVIQVNRFPQRLWWSFPVLSSNKRLAFHRELILILFPSPSYDVCVYLCYFKRNVIS